MPDIVADAGPLLVALAEHDAGLGRALAAWCTSNPERPLARFGASLLRVVGTRSREDLRGLLETLRVGDTAARRQLAAFLAMATWVQEPEGPEASMLRELIADADRVVVNTSLIAVLRIAEQQPELAIDIALQANVGSDKHLADRLCEAVRRITDRFSESQVRRLLDKLRPVTELGYWPNQVLGDFSPRHREEVLELLLARAAAGGDVRGLAFHDYDVDLLGGAEGDELRALLRRVRDTALDAGSRLRWELAHLYWKLTPELDAALDVLLEWLVSDDEPQVGAALSLLEDMEWSIVLARPEFVEKALTAAQARGRASLDKVRGQLYSVAAIAGSHSRTGGEPSPRDVCLRDEGRQCAERFGPLSPARRFFEDVVSRAEKNIEEAALEDEEYPEH